MPVVRFASKIKAIMIMESKYYNVTVLYIYINSR